MILTTLHLGQMPGRARRRVVCRQHQPLGVGVRPAAWRSIRAGVPAFGGFRATRLAAAGYMGDVDGGELSICTNATTTDATAVNTKRPARYLGTRTT